MRLASGNRSVSNVASSGAGGLVVSGSPRTLFCTLVRGAMERERLRSSAMGEFYLVTLLEAQLHPPEPLGSQPLGLQLLEALGASRTARYRGLRRVGDAALTLCGLFPESLERSLVGPEYYHALGRRAYGSLASPSSGAAEHTGLTALFSELADGFEGFAAVLGHVAFDALFARDADLLRLYRQWHYTRSRDAAARLAQRGVIPVMPGPDARH
jgi:hypothetical protein